jgi:aquaporin Z
MDLARKMVAEFIGTFWLVLVGAGSAVLAGGAPDVGIGWLGVAIAFGVALTTIAYVIGGISGCHINPAVTLGLWIGGRMKTKDVVPYVVAQVLGAIVAAAVLYAIASGKPGFDVDQGFAANGFGDHSPDGYNLGAAFVTEVVLTLIFLVDNASVNPARSTGPAVFVGGWALEQLWLFWVAPIVGALLGALLYRLIHSKDTAGLQATPATPKPRPSSSASGRNRMDEA